jgi:Fe-S-cluster containining protein
VIFANVKLLPEDDVPKLLELDMPLLKIRSKRDNSFSASLKSVKWRFLQPCAAYDGCRCEIYSARPKYCREFDCLLLKSVQEGKTTRARALRVIRAARRQADLVKKLLGLLGDTQENVALADRFRRLSKLLTQAGLDKAQANLFSQLSLAFHDLNLLLNDAFYPAPPK